jgi:hypothetical protein
VLCLVLAVVLLIEGVWLAALILVAATALHEIVIRRQRALASSDTAVRRQVHPPM